MKNRAAGRVLTRLRQISFSWISLILTETVQCLVKKNPNQIYGKNVNYEVTDEM